MKTVSVKLDDELIEHLEALARKLSISKSDLIRIAIKLYLQQLEKQLDDINE